MSLVVPFEEIFTEETGLIGKHPTWQRVELGEVCHVINGYPFRSDLFNREKGFPVVRIRDLSKEATETFYNGEIPEESIISNGDLLVGMDGIFRCYEWRGGKAGLNQRVCKLVPDPRFLLPKFLLFGINGYLKAIEDATSSVTVGHLSSLDVLRIPLPLPPLNEQRRIVAKLQKLLGKVDACQQRLTKIPIILKRFRQSVLAAACSGRLTADWRETDQYENDLPATWTMGRLSELSQLITKGASPKWQGVNYAESGVLFITSENVGWGKMLLGKKKFVESKINEIQPRSVLQNGDVLTNIVGASIGRSAIFDNEDVANINQAVALIRLTNAVNRKYILHVLNSPMVIKHMEDAKVDVARANLSLKNVGNYSIPLPPLSEQHEIIQRIELLFALADQIEARFATAKARVDRLTQSILAKAFRGELVPQDPNDERASVLLERIKAERKKGETEGKGGGKKHLKVNRKGKGR